ncbi:NUDIX domain-containing protein [Halorussus halobius]|uniref:NUDIX domain-containing protein n=1 Tax=Halorussus halobius TaxID=1710537 RepID=UPI00109323D7|nr:NUDIX domain-containing protein [Halorussus halobius]
MTDGSEPFVGKITQKAVLFGPDGDVLVTRVDDHWEPPGGTFEFGETLVGGLRRELREELGLDATVGPPVEAAYGGWLDGETANPMVALVYRCETDQRAVTLNYEHDDYEWVAPETAADRLRATFGERVGRAVERAVALDGGEPFEAVADPYADGDVTREEVLAELAAARAADGPGDLESNP